MRLRSHWRRGGAALAAGLLLSVTSAVGLSIPAFGATPGSVTVEDTDNLRSCALGLLQFSIANTTDVAQGVTARGFISPATSGDSVVDHVDVAAHSTQLVTLKTGPFSVTWTLDSTGAVLLHDANPVGPCQTIVDYGYTVHDGSSVLIPSILPCTRFSMEPLGAVHGTITVVSAGEIPSSSPNLRYTPNGDFVGIDRYHWSCSLAGLVSGTFTIHVLPAVPPTLASTGAAVWWEIVAGICLVLAGAGILTAARRSRPLSSG